MTARLAIVAMLAALTAGSLTAAAQDAPQSQDAPAGGDNDTRLIGAGEKSHEKISKSDGGGWREWLRWFAALAVVAGLLYVTAVAAKKMSGRSMLGGAGGAIQVLSRASLSPRHYVYLVKMGERLVFVGATSQSLATLAEVTDADEAARLMESLDSTSFGGLLKRRKREFEEKMPSAAPTEPVQPAGEARLLGEKLRRMNQEPRT